MQSKWWTKAQMAYLFDHALAMARSSEPLVRRIALPAFVVMIAWLATARAEDLLDQEARFQIAALPLANALIEFSTQSGLQVAAAATDVANLKSNSVNGTLPSRVALSTLLRGTGLEFSRVGDETVAIRSASNAPPAGRVTRAGSSGAIANVAMAKPAQPEPETSASAPPQMPDVSVTAPRPPTDQELAGDSLHQFIVHHATTHFVDISTARNLARWRGGKQSICPETVGLSPGYNAFVTARLRALAAYVGAPVQSDPHCRSNVQIFFANNPQDRMNDVFKWATVYFRSRYSGGMRDLIAYRSDYAIQGWYMTTNGDGALNTDVELVGLNVLPVWPQIAQYGSGSGNGIGIVILVIDSPKVVGYTIGTIADYLAMLTLSVAQSPDHCDPLPSILDLMASSCGTREMPTAVTAGDLAFLKALYYKNTGLGPSLSRAEIDANMMRQFNRR
jgi:hypothetical protein